MIILLDNSCHIFIKFNLFSAVYMFCNSAFEQSNLDLQSYVNALLL